MTVEQMLAHVQRPIAVAYGRHQLRANFIVKLIGPLFKSVLYDKKPYKHGLPTDKSYIAADKKNFENERERLIEMINDLLNKISPMRSTLPSAKSQKNNGARLPGNICIITCRSLRLKTFFK